MTGTDLPHVPGPAAAVGSPAGRPASGASWTVASEGAPATAAAGARPRPARERLNLIDQITASSVASDYGPATAHASPSGRRQRVLVTAFALGIVGVIMAMGISARSQNAPVVGEQRAALRARIDQTDKQGEQLAAQVTALRLEVQAARAADLAATQTGRELSSEVSQYELVTGYTTVTGPGAVVRLSDSSTPDPDDPALSKVLDTDVQAAVNGLWTVGAEAISVNGQRITARSAIRSAAGAILVNYRPLTPPYAVSAIGPEGLAERFQATQAADQLRAVARQFGIGFVTESADALVLPPATTALPEQATVIQDEEGTPTP
jgi:uncharacterized protein YlxW (UPF0749 family)